tara:strand:- start:44 stop:961 length:918 start_codon:yes stop_codon:yes gene_type:complete
MARNEDFRKETREKLKPKFKTKRLFVTGSSKDNKDQILTEDYNEMSKSFSENTYLSPNKTNDAPLGAVVYMMNEIKDDIVDIHTEISRSVYVSQVSEYSNIATASIGSISSSLFPHKEDTYNLGSASMEWHTAYMLTASIGGGIFTSASLAGGGGNADFSSVGENIVPDSDNARDLGSSTKEFRNLYIDGIAYIDSIAGGTLTRPIRTIVTAVTGAPKNNTLDAGDTNAFEFNASKAITIDLIAPSFPGQEITIMNINSGAVTITRSSKGQARTIYHAKGANLTINQHEAYKLVCNQNQVWYVIS